MTLSSFKNTRKHGLLLFVGCFLFFSWIMCCTPLYLDDYEFKALSFASGKDFIQYILQYGNGRILGNISSICLVHFPTLAALIRALGITSIIFLVPTLLGLNSPKWYLISFLLYTAIDPLLFGEVYTWISGFYNYIPPIWMTLVVLWLLKGFSRFSSMVKALSCVAVFVLGFASQLFVEHSSIINVMLALLAVGYCLSRDRSRLVISILWLLGTVCGIAVMFLTPVLFYVENNRSTGYRSFNTGSMKELILSCVKNALKIGNHYYGTTALPFGIGALVTLRMTRKQRSHTISTWLTAITAICMFYVAFGTGLKLDGWYGELALLQHGLMLISAAAPLVVWLFAALALKKNLRCKVLTLLLLTLFSLAPILVVNPVPVRIIFQSYIFATAALLLCLQQWMEEIVPQRISAIQTVCATGCGALVLVLSLLYGTVFSMHTLRQEYIDREISTGNTNILIFYLPYEYTDRDTNGGLEAYYRVVQPELSFHVLNYDQWMNDVLPNLDH